MAKVPLFRDGVPLFKDGVPLFGDSGDPCCCGGGTPPVCQSCPAGSPIIRGCCFATDSVATITWALSNITYQSGGDGDTIDFSGVISGSHEILNSSPCGFHENSEVVGQENSIDFNGVPNGIPGWSGGLNLLSGGHGFQIPLALGGSVTGTSFTSRGTAIGTTACCGIANTIDDNVSIVVDADWVYTATVTVTVEISNNRCCLSPVVSPWDESTTYAAGDLVRLDAEDGSSSIWRSLVNGNIGHEPPAATYWELVGSPGCNPQVADACPDADECAFEEGI